MRKMPLWQMVKEAANNLGPNSENLSYPQIKQYLFDKYNIDKNRNSLNAIIQSSCVNFKTRVSWPENQKIRKSDTDRDFLYHVGRGTVALYNKEKHGEWEIIKDENDNFKVHKIDNSIPIIEDIPIEPDLSAEESSDFTFALESQLRDFIAQNLPLIDENLSLYVSEEGIDGVEFHTEVGRIDILAVNTEDEFVVIELKLSRGEDVALGQIQRYMGWVHKHLSIHKPVKGIIIAKNFSDKLKYAISIAKNVSLFEYVIHFNINKAKNI